MLDTVSEAVRSEAVQANRRFGPLAKGLVQLPVLAVGAQQRSDDEFLKSRCEALLGGGVGSQLDVELERLPVCLIALGRQVELPADGPRNLRVLQVLQSRFVM